MADRPRNRREWLLGAGALGGVSGLTFAAMAGQRSPSAPPAPGESAGEVAFTQTGMGAVRRSVASKLGEMVSARDFGAVGDGRADDSPALQAWLEVGLAGRTLYLPAGRYRLTRSLSGRVRDGSRDGLRVAIIGDGAANTEILFEGSRDEPALSLFGNMPQFENLVLRGLRIARPDAGAAGLGTGAGFRLENFRNFDLQDLRTFRVGVGIHLVGCLVGRVSGYLSYYDRKGIMLERGSRLSTPNAISLELCSILASHDVGVHISQPSLVRMGNGSTIEGVGVENPGGTAIGLLAEDAGHAGGIGVIGEGVYFENNVGEDVHIRHGGQAAAYRFEGCTFNRLGQIRTQRSIMMEMTDPRGRAVLDVRGSAFMGYLGYRPSRETPYVGFALPTGATGLTFLDDGALYYHDEERPQVPAPVAHPAMAAVTGLVRADGRVERGRGIVSAAWVREGQCEIRLAAGTRGLVVNLTPYGRRQHLTIVRETGDTLVIEVVDAASQRPANGDFAIAGFQS